LQGNHAVKKAVILGIEQCQVTVVAKELDACRKGAAQSLSGQCDKARVADNMGIREDPFAKPGQIDHEPGAYTPTGPAGIPRRAVIGFLVGDIYADHTAGKIRSHRGHGISGPRFQQSHGSEREQSEYTDREKAFHAVCNIRRTDITLQPKPVRE
jgi:hypothetical protein